jgi:apolipoprotein D and lipocalin family protein
MRSLCLLLVVTTAVLGQTAPMKPVTPVDTVDLNRYAGTWFEIARYPNRFQRQCAGDTTATYSVRPDGRVTVTNKCRRADGSFDEAVGIARRVEGDSRAVLKVRFAPAWLSFIPQVWGDYWILALPEDYRYVVIGEPSRNYLWILARTSALDERDYAAAVAAAVANGYDESRLVRTPQSPAHGG